MWKSGWNLDREWVKRNEKWLILLVLGLAILILYAPFGKKTSETGVWQSGERWAESGTGTNSGNRAGQDLLFGALQSFLVQFCFARLCLAKSNLFSVRLP